MEKDYSKMIAEIINSLNWDVILACNQERVPARFSDKKSEKPNLKKELKELLGFIIDTNIKHFEHDSWIINWNDGKLEVLFCPTRSSKNETEIDLENESTDEQEIRELMELLVKSEREEKYELCAAIKSNIRKLNRIKK